MRCWSPHASGCCLRALSSLSAVCVVYDCVVVRKKRQDGDSDRLGR